MKHQRCRCLGGMQPFYIHSNKLQLLYLSVQQSQCSIIVMQIVMQCNSCIMKLKLKSAATSCSTALFAEWDGTKPGLWTGLDCGLDWTQKLTVFRGVTNISHAHNTILFSRYLQRRCNGEIVPNPKPKTLKSSPNSAQYGPNSASMDLTAPSIRLELDSP